jgi:hypothetical protein
MKNIKATNGTSRSEILRIADFSILGDAETVGMSFLRLIYGLSQARFKAYVMR